MGRGDTSSPVLFSQARDRSASVMSAPGGGFAASSTVADADARIPLSIFLYFFVYLFLPFSLFGVRMCAFLCFAFLRFCVRVWLFWFLAWCSVLVFSSPRREQKKEEKKCTPICRCCLVPSCSQSPGAAVCGVPPPPPFFPCCPGTPSVFFLFFKLLVRAPLSLPPNRARSPQEKFRFYLTHKTRDPNSLVLFASMFGVSTFPLLSSCRKKKRASVSFFHICCCGGGAQGSGSISVDDYVRIQHKKSKCWFVSEKEGEDVQGEHLAPLSLSLTQTHVHTRAHPLSWSACLSWSFLVSLGLS